MEVNRMNYKEAMDYISKTAKFGMNLGLQRILKLLQYMGSPEKNLKCIHIGGTNGKGSVTSMITSMLMESGFKVGMYTSPYIQRFSERIKVDGQEISEDDIARLVTYIKPIVDMIISEGYEHPTEFEIITALMFKYFEEKKVDFAILEVGLGGRLDSTNVINPLVSVITSIDFDHMAILGNTLGEIAYEKAGIVKEDGVVVIYPQQKEAYDVIREVCEKKHAMLIDAGDGSACLIDYSMDGQIFDIGFKDLVYERLFIKLIGEHQILNAKTAVVAVRALSIKGVDIKKDAIYEGLKKTKWPGRLEVMKKNPVVLLDGAHNIQGALGLKQALQKYFNYRSLILVIGILKDKQVMEMCDILMPMADTIITTTPSSDRAMPAEDLGKIASSYTKDVIVSSTIEEAFKNGMAIVEKEDLLLFCGSLYMIGHVRTLIEEM